MPAELRRWRLPALLGAGLIGAALIYANRIEPRWLRVRYVPVRLPHLHPAFHDYRIVHITDLHLGGSGGLTDARLCDTVALINALRPDMVALTGDYVEAKGKAASRLIGPLAALRAPDGVTAVLGNHDYRRAPDTVRDALAQAGVRVLSNSVHTLRRGAGSLHIAGVDDVVEGHDCLDAVLDALPPDGAAVLLAHEPDFADISAPTGRFDLQLSGHSHAGQIRLPLLGALVLPPFSRQYPAGRYQVGDMVQYTNAGLGTTAPHLRFNARPEVTVLILESEAVISPPPGDFPPAPHLR
jgi:predicted MPP superfamily phosphohydrolase